MIDNTAPTEPDRGRLLNFPTAHVFRPARGIGAGIGTAAAAIGILLGLALVARGVLRGVSFAAFGSEVLGVALVSLGLLAAYWAYAIYNLRYVVDDDSLLIVWGMTRAVITVSEIERIVLGRRYGEPSVGGLSWPGYHVGPGHVQRIGEVLFYSTHRAPEELIYLSTARATFGLSPSDARGLARAIQVAQEQLPDSAGTVTAEHGMLPLQAIFLDRRVLLLAGGAVVTFLLAAGYIYSRYQALPLSLTLPYPPANGPQRIGMRTELLRLPETALLWLLIGFGLAAWSHSRLRAVCYALLTGTLFAECLYAFGALAAAH